MDQSSLVSDSNTESKGIIEKPSKAVKIKDIDVLEQLQEFANGKSDNQDNDQPRCSNKGAIHIENELLSMNDQGSDADIDLISGDRFNVVVQQSLSEDSDRSSNCALSNETELITSNAVSDVRPSADDGREIVGVVEITEIVSSNMADDNESNGNHSDSDSEWVTDDEGDDDDDDGGSEDYSNEHSQILDDSDDDSDDSYGYEHEDSFETNDLIREEMFKAMLERHTHSYEYKVRPGVLEDCPICLHTFVDQESVRSLPCFHRFHTACVDEWLKKRKKICPACRMNVKSTADYLNESALQRDVNVTVSFFRILISINESMG